jgi:hypothetical protein
MLPRSRQSWYRRLDEIGWSPHWEFFKNSVSLLRLRLFWEQKKLQAGKLLMHKNLEIMCRSIFLKIFFFLLKNIDISKCFIRIISAHMRVSRGVSAPLSTYDTSKKHLWVWQTRYLGRVEEKRRVLKWRFFWENTFQKRLVQQISLWQPRDAFFMEDNKTSRFQREEYRFST